MIERKTLLAKLAVVAPALSKTDFTPLLTEFWFSGSRVMAFNEQLAVSIPLKTEFKGSVRGDALLSLLKLSKARDVELTAIDDNLNIKAASTRIKLGLRPREQSASVFLMPKFDDARPRIKINKALVDAIRLVMRSVSTDSTTPDKVGITLIPDGDAVKLFTTNDLTMSRAVVSGIAKGAIKKRVILTTAFCEQIVSLYSTSAESDMQMLDDAMLAHFGDIHVFGHLIESESPLDYDRVFDHHYTAKTAKAFVPIPTKLGGIIERAALISESKAGRTKTKVSIGGGKATFYSLSPTGEVRDHMQIDERHPDVSVLLEARLIKGALGNFDGILITSDAALFASRGGVHLISASAESPDQAKGAARTRKNEAGQASKHRQAREDAEDIPF